MNKIILSLFTAGILSAIACNQHPQPPATTTTTGAAVKASVYACPMQCEGDKTYPQAGQCPKCGMDLELVDTESDADSLQHNH